jgi:DNA polymerase elongation subunit (family B)
MANCIGWLLNVCINNGYAVLWIKTTEGQILKIRDSYHPGFYILPRNDADGLHLFQTLSREEEISVSSEDKYTNLFDRTKQRKLLYAQLHSLGYYQPLLKKLQNDYRVKQLFNTDLLHVQQYLFTKLKIEPTSKVEVEYDADGLKLLGISKVDDATDVKPPPFSLLYFDLHTYSGILASEDAIRIIKVRYGEDEAVFDNGDEKVILQKFSDYVHEKDPDIIVCLGDYDNGKKLRYLSDRAEKIGLDLQLRICISSSYRKTTYFDEFGFAGLIERARFGFLPLDKAAKYSINRLIDSRNCFELIQRGFVIPSRVRGIDNNNHEQIRTVEQIVSGDKGGMIISPQIGLHEDVLALDYDSEYANLIVNHNLSYETVSGGEKAVNRQNKGLLPTVVERYLKRRIYFKKLFKKLPKDSIEYVYCEQRVNSLKNILVCLYGSTGSLWNRFGNVLAFEEINRLSREVLIKTKDIVQGLGYELVYADTDSVFIKKKDSATDYNELIDILSKETGLSISVDYHYKFLVLLPLESDEKIEVLKHYFGITFDNEIVVRGIEVRRHDIPAFIKRFQTQVLYTLFDCRDSSEVQTKGYENSLVLVTQAIDTIMTGEGLDDKDLIISKLLRQDIQKYRSLFPHVSAAIQSRRYPLKGETIQYIYTDSKHNNPLCRVTPIESEFIPQYDKEKYKEMILDAAEIVPGYFGFDRTAYSDIKKGRRKTWYEEIREQRARDIETEMIFNARGMEYIAKWSHILIDDLSKM